MPGTGSWGAAALAAHMPLRLAASTPCKHTVTQGVSERLRLASKARSLPCSRSGLSAGGRVRLGLHVEQRAAVRALTRELQSRLRTAASDMQGAGEVLGFWADPCARMLACLTLCLLSPPHMRSPRPCLRASPRTRSFRCLPRSLPRFPDAVREIQSDHGAIAQLAAQAAELAGSEAGQLAERHRRAQEDLAAERAHREDLERELRVGRSLDALRLCQRQQLRKTPL